MAPPPVAWKQPGVSPKYFVKRVDSLQFFLYNDGVDVPLQWVSQHGRALRQGRPNPRIVPWVCIGAADNQLGDVSR